MRVTVAAVGILTLAACSTGAGTSDGGGVSLDGPLPVWEFDVIPVEAPGGIDRFDTDGLIPRCTTLNAFACACVGGAPGVQVCQDDGRWGPCDCRARAVAPNLPPRLLWPTTSHTVTSQRPTLRWVLPDNVTRARVELCDDRACTRRLMLVDVTGTSWRSPTPLRPGVVFWRVMGLSSAGAVVWTSATWSFAVRRRDTPVDTILGRYKDFNGDGYDDLITVGASREDPLAVLLHLWLGSATGLAPTPSFDTLIRAYADYSTVALVSGDVNGDGLADLLSAWGTGATPARSAQVYHGQRDGTLEGPHPAGAGPMYRSGAVAAAIELLDFNGDGFDDAFAVGAGLNATTLSIRLGSPKGASSTPAVSEWNRPRDPVAGNAAGGDYNGDGYSDLTAWVPDSLAAFPGNPEGSVPMPPEGRDAFHGFLTREGERGLWAADVDGDQDTDVISGTQVAPLYAVGGTLHHLYRYDSRYDFGGATLPWQWVGLGSTGRPGDVNGDGYPDAPAVELCGMPLSGLDFDAGNLGCGGGRAVLYPGGPAGLSKAPLWTQDAPTGAWISVAGDLDGDGGDEVIYARDAQFTIGRWRDGAVAWDPPRTVPAILRVVRVH